MTIPGLAPKREGDRRKRVAPCILLVEDEASLVLTLIDCLVAEGYQVESRGDGESAFERAAEQTFDLAILDDAPAPCCLTSQQPCPLLAPRAVVGIPP